MGKDKNVKFQHRINNFIKAREVMLVGENVERGVYSISEALKMADDLELDLVEISPSVIPPVCKIMDYQKFLYDKHKNEKKPQKVVIKEIRINPYIDTNDFQRKIKQAYEFLEKGFKVKIDSLIGGGRRWEDCKNNILEMAKTLIKEVEEVGIIESAPTIIGSKMNCIIRPKKQI